MSGNGSGRLRFGAFEVDLHTRELWKYGTRIKLIGQPFEILAVLLSRPGELVTREELKARLWPGDTFVDFNHGLNAAVNKLRDVLSDSADEPRYVETLPRRGYRFIGTVEPVNVPVQAPTTGIDTNIGSSAPMNLSTESLPQAFQAEDSRLLRPRYVSIALALAILALGVGILVKRDVANANGRVVDWKRTRPLTSAADNAGNAAFSPDGNSVAFVREGPIAGESGIFVKNIDSDSVVQLTHNDDDCCPVWSPDSKSIAFTRREKEEVSVYIVPSAGGHEHKFDTNGLKLTREAIDWSPDGKSMAVSAGGIFLVSVDASQSRRVTSPSADSQDWGPKFSADGKRILFVREHEIGLPAEILITGGETEHVVSEPGQIVGPPQWSPDEQSVIYASDRGGHPSIWRVDLKLPGKPLELGVAGAPTWFPVVSRRGFRMAYQKQTRGLSVWEMELLGNKARPPHVLLPWTSDTDQGPGPQFSPDGKKLAYMSDRSGTMEIWVSNRDGSNAFQLTNVGGAGTPRWSPDSQAIVFDTRRNTSIVSVSLEGGTPRMLVQDSFNNVCPSWSRDGKWVYFAAEHNDVFQVWKVPAEGGTPVQVTHHGGHAALESLDGKTLYYAKDSKPEPEIWSTPAQGGPEARVPLVRPGTWASWQIVKGGIVFVGPSLGHEAVLSSYRFATGRVTTLSVLPLVPFWLGADLDGKAVAFDQLGREQSQIMMVENFQ